MSRHHRGTPADELPVGRLNTVVLDDPLVVAASPSMHATTAPEIRIEPGQSAYLIYTSGSTGRPKGVHITHQALLNYVTVAPQATRLGRPGATYALLQPAVTDFANTVIYISLTTGGTLHLPPDTGDADQIATYLAEHPIDYLKIVPSHLAALTQVIEPEQLLPRTTLLLGGEAGTPEQISALLDHRPDVVNHYGPTETTIGVATLRLQPDHTSGTAIPIGTPLPNTRLHVLDPHLSPVPDGHHRRAVHRRRRTGAWLPQPARSHRLPLHRRPRRPTSLPHRRPGTAPQRPRRVPRPHRPPDQAARPPHRTRRDPARSDPAPIHHECPRRPGPRPAHRLPDHARRHALDQ